VSEQTTTYVERLALRNAYMRELIQTSIHRRWGATAWDIFFPWWRQPEKIRILMYADGCVCFSGGLFGGLQYVKTLLESRLYFYADFEITTAHRDGDPCDRNSPPLKLTELDILNKFDEIWFFGFNLDPDLSKEELALLDRFMGNERQGGVLVTGDHFDRGKSIAGQLTRAGKMRQYPAPDSVPNSWNITLVEGPDQNTLFNDNDQNDECAQQVRCTLFPGSSPFGSTRRFSPHPVMCGPDGPIDVFPDHQHEGEALAPKVEKKDTEWPTVNGHQEPPVVIARGKISDPSADKFGQEIGLVSAYDGHKMNVGRILADSSWHHWFDFNLLGLPGRVPPHPYAGFDATPGGMAVLKKLDAYFLNCATWLAPPERQAEMRRAAWWSILWTDQIAELSVNHPIWHLGAQALDALTMRASSCVATGWVLDIPAFKEQISNQQLSKITERFQILNLPFEQYVAGGIIRELMRQVGPANPELCFPSEPPPDEAIECAINDGVVFGMKALGKQLNYEVKHLAGMVKNKFRLQ
jgi:hypothetical protein